MMKSPVSLVLIVVLFVIACSMPEKRVAQAGETIIVGKVTNPTPKGMVVLERMSTAGVEKVDSVELAGDSTFTFYVDEGEQAFYRIDLFDRQYVTFIMGASDTLINITADGSIATGDFTVSGSVVNEEKNDIDAVERRFRLLVNNLEERAINAREMDDTETFQKIRLEYFRSLKKKDKELKEAIWNASPNLSAIYGLSYLDINAEYSFFDSVATRMKAVEQPLGFAQALISQVEDMKRLAVGSPAPDFTLPNPDGEQVSLSSLKGKYVLIDFWAAWCRPCRMENPNVKLVYEAYADKGFEILGVSLDRKKSDWLKAIEKDGLPWKHVSDLKYFNSEAARLYEIQAIPATYLIDPEGNILAKGLRGPSLRAKLKEIFG
ncbi:MAG: TlpA disulfide reductase family protein [Bacteroidota bacterium]